MSKSLYQYKINPDQAQQIAMILNRAIPMQKYKSKGADNLFVMGNGWFTGKRKMQYKIVGDVLSICVWKVVAPIIPMWEMGCSDANNTYGFALNAGMKTAVECAVSVAAQQCSITPMTVCMTVDDLFLERLGMVTPGAQG